MYSAANIEATYGCRVTYEYLDRTSPYLPENVEGPPFCYKMDFKVISPHHIIFLYHYNRPREDTIQFVFWCYKKVGDKCTECCYLSDGKKIASEELSSESDMAKRALEKFNDALELHRDTVEDLYLENVSTLSSEPINLGTTIIPKLRNVRFVDTTGFEQIMSVLPEKLEKFKIRGAQLNPSILECRKFFSVAKDLDARDLEMDWTQFQMLTASHIAMKIGTLTEENVYEVIKKWRVEADVQSFSFDLTGTNFDFDLLLKLVDLPYNQCEAHDFYHPKLFGKGATLDIVKLSPVTRLLQFEEFDD